MALWKALIWENTKLKKKANKLLALAKLRRNSAILKHLQFQKVYSISCKHYFINIYINANFTLYDYLYKIILFYM